MCSGIMALGDPGGDKIKGTLPGEGGFWSGDPDGDAGGDIDWSRKLYPEGSNEGSSMWWGIIEKLSPRALRKGLLNLASKEMSSPGRYSSPRCIS